MAKTLFLVENAKYVQIFQPDEVWTSLKLMEPVITVSIQSVSFVKVLAICPHTENTKFILSMKFIC